jgi:capsular exopolysaccharide synthesis family protein
MTNQDGIEFQRIFLVIRRWWWLIVGCALMSAVMAFLYMNAQDPKYEASTMLLVSPGKYTQTNEYNTLVAAEKLALTYNEMLQGETILETVISQLGLRVTPGQLAGMIKVETIPSTQLIRLTVASTSPTQAALLADTIAKTFITQVQKLQTERYASSLSSQQKAIDAVTTARKETQEQINGLNASKIADEAMLNRLEKQVSLQRSELQSLERDYQDFQFNATQLTDIVKVVEPAQVPANDNAQPYQVTITLMVGSTQDSGSAEYLTGFTNDQLTQTFQEIMTGRNVLEAVIERLGLKESYQSLLGKTKVVPVQGTKLFRLNVYDNDTEKAVLIADTIIEIFLENIKTLLEGPYTARLANMQEEIDDLSTQIEGTQAEIDALNASKVQTEMELAEQQNLLTEQRNNYQALQQSYEQSNLAVTNTSEAVQIVEAAKVPEWPVGSNKKMYTAVAAILGALIGMGVAFFIEFQNGTLQSPDEITRELGLTVLGTIGRLSNKEKGLVVDSHPRSPNAEAFRVLAANIRYSSLVNPRRILLVTSPLAEEGKSIITANLATALALTEMRVMVVDADLRKPEQHRLFGIKQGGGLTSALLDGTLDGRVKQIEAPKLKLLTSGHLPPNPADMLGSARMLKLLEELREQADIVFIDCPPIMPVADAMILAPHVDGVILVLRSNRTQTKVAIEAVERLRNGGANFVGVVLNGVQRSGKYYYYSKSEEKKGKSGFEKILEGFSTLRNKVLKKGQLPQ